MRFENKVVLITGGGNGMGRASALRFAAEGAAVVAADIEADSAARVAQEIRASGGRALNLNVDVSSRDSVTEMVERTVAEFGRVDILCAIAGIGGGVPFLELTDAQWNRMLAVDLTGVFLCGQAAARQMVKQGTGGKIVNMSSTNGLVGEAEFAHYNAAKFGVVGLTMTMAIELAPHNITVNAVCPGLIMTRLSHEISLDPAAAADYKKKIPMARFGTANEVAGAFLFLASDDASYITGTTLVVDGGQLTF